MHMTRKSKSIPLPSRSSPSEQPMRLPQVAESPKSLIQGEYCSQPLLNMTKLPRFERSFVHGAVVGMVCTAIIVLFVHAQFIVSHTLLEAHSRSGPVTAMKCLFWPTMDSCAENAYRLQMSLAALIFGALFFFGMRRRNGSTSNFPKEKQVAVAHVHDLGRAVAASPCSVCSTPSVESEAPEDALRIRIGNSEVPVTAEPGIEVLQATTAVPFVDWAHTIGDDPRIAISRIHIQSVDMLHGRVGFLKLKADVQVDGKKAPGIVFMRGGSVAILVILEHNSKLYSLLVRQPRIALGQSGWLEIPAGMLDGDGNFGGVAAREMEEETGIIIRQSDLVDLTALAFGNKHPGMYPSCGSCDEFNRIFLFRKKVASEEFASLQGRLTGIGTEQIRLQIIPLNDLWHLPDGKSLVALLLFEKLVESGAIPRYFKCERRHSDGDVLSRLVNSEPLVPRKSSKLTAWCEEDI